MSELDNRSTGGIKLLPCPFCGCKDVSFFRYRTDRGYEYQIECHECFNGTCQCESKELAVKRWNTRKPVDTANRVSTSCHDMSYHTRN